VRPYHGGVNDSSPDPDLEPAAVNPEPAAAPDPEPAATVVVAPVSSFPPMPAHDDTGVNTDRAASTRRQNRAALFGTIAMLVVLAFGGGLVVGRATAPAGTGASPVAGTGASTASPGPAATPVASAGAAVPSDGPRLGRADAKVTVEYWADYQCPFCAKFARDIIPQLKSRIDDGTVSLLHRDFAFIGEESVGAAVAVRCAGSQGKYWAMHDAVYAAQAGENQGGFAPAKLAQIAASVGLDPAAFATCVADKASLVAVLDDTAAGVRAGIVSTPTIDVNGNRFLGVSDVPKFLAAIDAAAAGASPAPLPTAVPSSDPWVGTVTNGREAGAATAPVTVELWMDYQSTDSAVLPKTLEPELRTRIASGAIRVVQRDLAVLGDESVVASGMVRCVARQGGSAWFVHDILSVSAQGPDAGIYTPANLLRLGSRLGLDVKALDTCLADPTVAAEVKAETAQGTALGLSAGPSVVIRAGDREVGRFSGPLDTKAVLAAIDAAK
jgi:protein-disulfide isomerase